MGCRCIKPCPRQKQCEQTAIYMVNNDSLDQDMIERILSGFNLENTLPSEVDVDGHPVRTMQDRGTFFYLLFDKKTAIAYIKTHELKLVGGRVAYQSQQAGVLQSKFGKALILKSYQGLLRDRILVSNDTQNAAGHNIFRRLWATGKYDFYVLNNRHKLVSEAVLPEGETQFVATVPGVRIYNSWSVLAVCAKANRVDNDWLKAQLPKTPAAALEANEEPSDDGAQVGDRVMLIDPLYDQVPATITKLPEEFMGQYEFKLLKGGRIVKTRLFYNLEDPEDPNNEQRLRDMGFPPKGGKASDVVIDV